MTLDTISMILGAVSICIPLVSIVFHKLLRTVKWWGILSTLLSMGLCVSAIGLQIYDVLYSILQSEDFFAVLDTVYELTFICIALLCVVFLLNAIHSGVRARED